MWSQCDLLCGRVGVVFTGTELLTRVRGLHAPLLLVLHIWVGFQLFVLWRCRQFTNVGHSLSISGLVDGQGIISWNS